MVKFCKLHTVFKILSMSHTLDIFLISSVYYKCSYKLSKSLNCPNLYINWAHMWFDLSSLIIKIKNSICACSIDSRVFIYVSNKPLCGTLIINLGKNSICASYCKQMKHPLQESNKNTKYVLATYVWTITHICLNKEQR